MTPWAIVVALLLLGAGCALVLRAGMRWGSSPAERALAVAGDEWLDGHARVVRVRMTRAVSVAAPVFEVWPWLAQLGRGAGWYSYDRLDNGGKSSAGRLVSWVPQPELGDATAIGYLRALTHGVELAWWFPDGSFVGATARAAYCYRLEPVGDQTRLIMRVSAEATGWTARLALWIVLPVVDSIMACRQLSRLAAQAGASTQREAEPETGSREQYQLYHVIYASGEEAGVRGREKAAEMRRAAQADGVLRRSQRSRTSEPAADANGARARPSRPDGRLS